MNLEKNDKVRKGHKLFGEKKKNSTFIQATIL